MILQQTEETDGEVDVAFGGSSLDAALANVDDRLATAGKALAAAHRQLKQAVEASRQGRASDLPRVLEGLVEATSAATRTALEAEEAWTFDVRAHLESGRYLDELIAAATRELPGIRTVDGQLFSFPVVVKIDARNLCLKIGKALHKGMRPSAVIGVLRRLRERPARENTRQLLQAFETAYLKETRGEVGTAVPLRRVYDLLVLRPGQSREYTEVDFLLDVYRLDRAETRVTAAGREISFPASTGTKGGRGTVFVTETGEERFYSSIRFDPE